MHPTLGPRKYPLVYEVNSFKMDLDTIVAETVYKPNASYRTGRTGKYHKGWGCLRLKLTRTGKILLLKCKIYLSAKRNWEQALNKYTTWLGCVGYAMWRSVEANYIPSNRTNRSEKDQTWSSPDAQRLAGRLCEVGFWERRAGGGGGWRDYGVDEYQGNDSWNLIDPLKELCFEKFFFVMGYWEDPRLPLLSVLTRNSDS